MSALHVLFISMLLGLCQACTASAQATTGISLTPGNAHDVTMKQLSDGSWEIHTTGTDPYVFSEQIAGGIDLQEAPVVAFEYFCTGGTDSVQVFAIPPLSEERSVTVGGLLNSEGFSQFAIDMTPALPLIKARVTQLRLDFGTIPNRTIRIRALHTRPLNEVELRLLSNKQDRLRADQEMDVALRKYLNTTFPCKISRVEVLNTAIRIVGATDGESGLNLVEAPIEFAITARSGFPFQSSLNTHSGHFSITVPRRDAAGRDRLLSRWFVGKSADGGVERRSHDHYADSVACASSEAAPVFRSKKGLGGYRLDAPQSDIADLGITSVTYNIVINGLLETTGEPGRTPFVSQGRTWYTNDAYVSDLDKALLEAQKHNLVVSAILLVSQGATAPAGSFARLIAHPDAEPAGIFAMPDVSHAQGVQAYAAALDLLSGRYCDPTSTHGRIHHWILHNEVNAGWIWTNAGEKTPLVYMYLYQRSMRIAQLVARTRNRYTQSWISLEHHWNMQLDHIYRGRELLDILAQFSRVEGDFDWGIAFHPYPQDLFNPRVWEDKEAVFAFDTPKITYKNLEVLDAYVQRPEMRYQGKAVRGVHLTEQGLNSKSYSANALADQAAGMAYAWSKVSRLKSILSFDYHNWIDNRGEGGLQIGLRKFPDDPADPLGKKPIWYVYQAAGTSKEAEEFGAYLERVRMKSWAESAYTGTIR